MHVFIAVVVVSISLNDVLQEFHMFYLLWFFFTFSYMAPGKNGCKRLC